MTIHPRALAAKMSHSPKMAARETGLTQNEVRAIRDLQTSRYAAQQFVDPLIAAKNSRVARTASALAEYRGRLAAAAAERDVEIEFAAKRRAKDIATRETLLAAARAARTLGFSVRSSIFDGRVSSYYCQAEAVSFRISDHDIPWTADRESKAMFAGKPGFSGFHGAQIIIDRPRSTTWLRRAIKLAAGGRSV